MAESIEMQFWVVGRVGQRYHVLDGDPTSPWKAAIFGGEMGGAM